MDYQGFLDRSPPPQSGLASSETGGMVRSAMERGEYECVGQDSITFLGEFSDLRTNRFDLGRPHERPICLIRPTRS